MIDRGGEYWCILRTASVATLPLVKALGDDGYRAWTPTEVQVRRARRSIPKQEITVALMPSMVFADHARLPDLLGMARAGMQYQVWDAQLRRMVTKGLPQFRVLRIGDRYARVADGELAGLRRAESVGLKPIKVRTLRPGVRVRMLTGLLEGLLGTVVNVRGDFARVQFPGWSETLTIAFHLLEVASTA